MRVVDLDRDMSDVIPTGSSPDSEFLFERMTDVTLALAGAASGRRILDVASGVGQDALALARAGADVVGAEPSARMIGMAGLVAARQEGPEPTWVRAWSDALPFATGSFDAAICKGAIDHFDRPEDAIAEMARVTRPGGRVVLAIANFESLSCRAGRFLEEFAAEPVRGRRVYDVPSDHFTRYELELMREQAERHIAIEELRGISLGWGLRAWSQAARRMPAAVVQPLLQAFDGLARRAPALADVIVLAGRPLRSATTSA